MMNTTRANSSIGVLTAWMVVVFAVDCLSVTNVQAQSIRLAQNTPNTPNVSRFAPDSVPLLKASVPQVQERVRVVGDTLIIFLPPRPFFDNVEPVRRKPNGLGVNGVVSSNGFGFGGFYQRELSPTWVLCADVLMSYRQNSDELEVADYRLQRYVVPGKLNRLFVAPITIGAQYRLNDVEVFDAVRPFIQAGLGTALIIATPYLRDDVFYEFIASFHQATLYGRFGGFVGVGLSVPGLGGAVSNLALRYYTIPFGGEGLESMNSATTAIPPIRDFGGIFLTCNIGFKF